MPTVTTPDHPAVDQLRAATARTEAVNADPHATREMREAAAQAEADLHARASAAALAEIDAESQAELEAGG